MRRSHLAVVILLTSTAILAGCGDDVAVTPPSGGPDLARSKPAAATEEAMLNYLDQINTGLAGRGANYRAAVAEYIGDGDEAGSVVVARSLGNKRLSEDFVPGDPRRVDWSGPSSPSDDNITFAIDATADATPNLGGLTGADTRAAILRAMASWENVSCSVLPLAEANNFGVDIGIVAALNGLGGSFALVADVQHAGFTDIDFPGGVLGVTFTFNFIDDNGDPTDIDSNNRDDVAFREIYYDAGRVWRVNANIDVESVALHEMGHGLSQAHFGNIFVRNDGSLDASPRAVMNALYLAPFQALAGTDTGGHCSNWANWPNR